MNVDLINVGILFIMAIVALLIGRWIFVYLVWWWNYTIYQKAQEKREEEEQEEVERPRHRKNIPKTIRKY